MLTNKLTVNELETLVSRFRSSCFRLRQSGDYPEEQFDEKLLKKLIGLLYDARKQMTSKAGGQQHDQ